MSNSSYQRHEHLVVYQKLWRLHIEVWALTHRKGEEDSELGVQEEPAKCRADAPPG